MEKVINKYFEGERALFNCSNIDIQDSVFANGESPLKESSNINLTKTSFNWKYPLWYSKEIKLLSCELSETARSGIWYTNDISIENSIINAPKTFRYSNSIKLNNVDLLNAEETLWNCKNIVINNSKIKGDYFGFNSSNLTLSNIQIDGNYSFDSAKNIVIKDSILNSKDAFWNCENVRVENSVIKGEYLGWNSQNITFVNCEIESLQGFCYIENLVMVGCRLINTNLAFEYSTVNVSVIGEIESIKNPKSGRISADFINEIIIETDKVNPNLTEIMIGGNKYEI